MKQKQCRQNLMNQYQDTETAAHQILNQYQDTQYQDTETFSIRMLKLLPVRFWISVPGRISSYLILQCHPSIAWWTSFQIQPTVFKYQNCHCQGLPPSKPWQSWCNLILQRVPSTFCHSDLTKWSISQTKHCNPLIPSHSRMSQVVPQEYGGNLHWVKYVHKPRVIF